MATYVPRLCLYSMFGVIHARDYSTNVVNGICSCQLLLCPVENWIFQLAIVLNDTAPQAPLNGGSASSIVLTGMCGSDREMQGRLDSAILAACTVKTSCRMTCAITMLKRTAHANIVTSSTA